MRVVEFFGLVLLGTSEGYVIEMFWPTQQEPASFRYKVSNHAVIWIRLL